MEETETVREITNKDDLPTSIIIRNVPKELFDDPSLKENFASMFTQISENVRIDFLKGFQRVRVVFTEPEHATAAKLIVEHHKFNGLELKAFFANNIKMVRRAYQSEDGHLKLPPLEKQFLISPPSSPPVGWEQCHEMAPVVCNFDLMSRLAAYSVDDKYEVHGGDPSQPTIVVTPAGVVEPVAPITEAETEEEESQPPSAYGKVEIPHTPRPPKRELDSTG
uniref:Calcipressin-1 n=1 Tax=Panagrellus redivivus TaxID=6233 RepID=A0A7E4W623_PANRE